jgi:hypothetical protein
MTNKDVGKEKEIYPYQWVFTIVIPPVSEWNKRWKFVVNKEKERNQNVKWKNQNVFS